MLSIFKRVTFKRNKKVYIQIFVCIIILLIPLILSMISIPQHFTLQVRNSKELMIPVDQNASYQMDWSVSQKIHYIECKDCSIIETGSSKELIKAYENDVIQIFPPKGTTICISTSKSNKSPPENLSIKYGKSNTSQYITIKLIEDSLHVSLDAEQSLRLSVRKHKEDRIDNSTIDVSQSGINIVCRNGKRESNNGGLTFFSKQIDIDNSQLFSDSLPDCHSPTLYVVGAVDKGVFGKISIDTSQFISSRSTVEASNIKQLQISDLTINTSGINAIIDGTVASIDINQFKIRFSILDKVISATPYLIQLSGPVSFLISIFVLIGHIREKRLPGSLAKRHRFRYGARS